MSHSHRLYGLSPEQYPDYAFGIAPPGADALSQGSAGCSHPAAVRRSASGVTRPGTEKADKPPMAKVGDPSFAIFLCAFTVRIAV